jgi:hypothetical protein
MMSVAVHAGGSVDVAASGVCSYPLSMIALYCSTGRVQLTAAEGVTDADELLSFRIMIRDSSSSWMKRAPLIQRSDEGSRPRREEGQVQKGER